MVCDFLDAIGSGVLAAGGRIGRFISGVPCNVKSYDDRYEVTANVSEYNKSDVKVKVKEGLLTISGEHLSDKEDGDGVYVVRERSCESFSRSFKLPGEIIEDEISAKYDNGILKVTIPRVKKEVPPEPEAKDVEIQ